MPQKKTPSKPNITEDTLNKWQGVVDLISELAHVPATLIMRTQGKHHAVSVKSNGTGNPYYKDQSFELNEQLYCFGVFQNDGELCVEDATTDTRWSDNQDLEHGMKFYIGLPLKWPDGELFGTICMLDRRRNKRALLFRKGLREFCRVVEDDLALLLEIEQRKLAEADLQRELASREIVIGRRTQKLEEANTALKVLLKSVETSKNEIEDRIAQRIKGLILPHISKLRNLCSTDDHSISHIEIIESNLRNIATINSTIMIETLQSLTPTEAEIAQMIVQGLRTKEIAKTLSRGTSTVDFHRDNIRKKLGLSNKQKNLRQYLISLQ